MLGNKRKKFGNSKKNNKKNEKGMKIKTFESRQSKKRDEEILSDQSEGENENIKDDKFFNVEEENIDETTTDQKRLSMAKKLIKKIGEKKKSEVNDDEDDREEINEYINKEISKEKKEHYIELINENFQLKEEKFIKGHKASITSLNLTNDSKFAITTSKDSRAILWDLNAEKRILLPKFSNKPLTLIGGDFNIVYKNTELTIPNPYEVTEIEIFQHFEKYFHETTNEQHITWWDYRYNAFQRNLGLGLDKVFLSKDLTPTNMTILKNFRAMEEPSDHAPILINFTLSKIHLFL